MTTETHDVVAVGGDAPCLAIARSGHGLASADDDYPRGTAVSGRQHERTSHE